MQGELLFRNLSPSYLFYMERVVHKLFSMRVIAVSGMISLGIPIMSMAWAGGSPPRTCTDSDVYHVKRPYFPEHPDSKESFELAYRYHPAAAGMPTVIYFPGGPGETSING